MTNQERELRIKIFQLDAEIEYCRIMMRGYLQLRSRNNNVWATESDKIAYESFNKAYIEKDEEYEKISAMFDDLTH